MINTSNEFDNQIMEAREFVLSANITLSDGTVLALNDTDIMQGGMEFEDATSGTSSFQIGGAIINKHTLTIQNYDGKYDEYEFTDAVVRPRVGLQLSETVESLNKGVFTVDEPNFTGSVIILECLDNMHKFEEPFSEVVLSFPATALTTLQAICTYCGVSLAINNFTNFNFIIQSRPDDEALSCLDMVSYIAQVAGDYARCNTAGALELKWYDMTVFENETNLDGGSFDGATPYASGDDIDGGNFTDYNSGDSFDGGTFLDLKKFWHLYDFGSTPTIGIDDVVITGIKVENTDSENGFSAMYGIDGYVLSITNNPLIQSQSDANVIANTVGAKIVGMRFRPFSASTLSNPAIEAGDPAKLSVRARDGFNVYYGYVTNLSYKVGSRETVQNNAESPSRNSSTRYSDATKTIVKTRNNTKQDISAYDATVQQFTNLITNGFGLFQTKVPDSSGGVIYYMHDKPSMEESVIRWFMTSTGMIEQNKVNGVWVTVSATDNQGNALYNVITARGIVADWIKAGNISAQNNSTWLNLDNGEFSFANGAISYSGGKFIIDTPNLKFNSDGSAVIDNTLVKGTIEAIWALIDELRIENGNIFRQDTSDLRLNEVNFSGNTFVMRNAGTDANGNVDTGKSSSGISLMNDRVYIFHRNEDGTYSDIYLNDINIHSVLENDRDDIDYLWDRVMYIDNYLANKFSDYEL